MIKLKELCIDMERTLQGDLSVIEAPKFYEKYDEGIKIGPGGTSFVCLSQALNYEKIVIKIPDLLDPVFEYVGKPVPVKFEGLEGKAWQDFGNKGEIKLTITAKKIIPINEKTNEKLNMGVKG